MAFKVFLAFVMIVCSTNAANILMIPVPSHSHCLEMVGIANELVKRGHFVFAYVPVKFKTHCFDSSNVTVIDFHMSEEGWRRNEEFGDFVTKTVFGGRTLMNSEFPSKMNNLAESVCEGALSSTEELKKLQSLHIDITLVDAMPLCNCLYYIPRFLKSPVVSVASAIFEGDSGMPFQTNTHPLLAVPYTSDMAYPQRFLNHLATVGFAFSLNVMNVFYQTDIDKLKKYVPADVFHIDKAQLIRQSVLFLENSDTILEYPKATFPNFLRVGGLTTRPTKPLPEELEKFMSQSKNGVVVVSFGSFLKNAPPYLFQKLLKVFQNLNHNVIMAYDKNENYGNVKTVKWLPQNDVLGHPNTVLFISHCGKNGFFEGFYHGVPIICTPLHADTFSTAIKVKYHKVGSSADILNGDANEILKVIKYTLNDENVRKNMKKASAIFHSAPFTPQERAANGIEHVLKFGGDHLKPVSSKMSLIAHTMLDIWFTLFLLTSIILYIFYRLIRGCFICIFCRKQNTTGKKKKD
ncbi:UDP-glucuronosyltransferase 2B20 isoform X2 [Patella vulgata]|nr:UDP-glucuronosyltransferase 2B20 isoform X2 [Patella vulgata]XP_050395242.1 UDP-glucuronosyltransferase 2B20 isoform X2 [Patella vulgata]XP_050395243.1 UDP-glucuronosyltransferase 2B20 isoform X2 [Patella vulgata]